MNVTRMGIDLAKQAFQLHGVDRTGKVLIRKQLRRARMLDYFGKQTACLIGMEACGGAHYWARELTKLGHDVRLMAPQFASRMLRAARTMPMMPKRYAKRLVGLTCVLLRSRRLSSKLFKPSTGYEPD